MNQAQEIARRRTFAIVSHPDAGKTTLTEKFLLYGGAVQLAGSVTARKQQRATVSDWLEIEKKRGISVSSTILSFDYNDFRINLLDTPGHNDFSEDTYRVLMAVDSVIMVIDAGKGVELQTRKLFEVCRKRHIPVFTFVNKMDRPARDILSILDEIEQVLDIRVYPMNWPLGAGTAFRGVWDCRTGMAHLFERTAGGAYRAPVSTCGLSDPAIKGVLSELDYATMIEESEIVLNAGVDFNLDDIAAGRTTPVFFGSAVNNFGIQILLDSFAELAPGPQPRLAGTTNVDPVTSPFSGFVFKIQANMDPRHRDRMAFVRIVSGMLSRDMTTTHVQSGKPIRMSNTSTVFGRERVSIEEAYAGDVIGLVSSGTFAIGDTLCESTGICFHEIPRFSPECFTVIYNPIPSDYKRFQNGIEQLVQEGLVHLFELTDAASKTLVLGAVGPLQFELVQYRLEAEYRVKARLERASYTLARWPVSGQLPPVKLTRGVVKATDSAGREVLLFEGEWHLRFFLENNEGIELQSFVCDVPQE